MTCQWFAVAYWTGVDVCFVYSVSTFFPMITAFNLGNPSIWNDTVLVQLILPPATDVNLWQRPGSVRASYPTFMMIGSRLACDTIKPVRLKSGPFLKTVERITISSFLLGFLRGEIACKSVTARCQLVSTRVEFAWRWSQEGGGQSQEQKKVILSPWDTVCVPESSHVQTFC